MPVVVTPSGGTFGARVAGLDLSAPLDDAGSAEAKALFHRRHKWRVGDVLIWDNCATIHMAAGAYDASTLRIMHRAQVLGGDALYRRENVT